MLITDDKGCNAKACSADSVKIAFFIRIFGKLNEIMQQPTALLFFFSIPLRISIKKTRKFKSFFSGKKLKKPRGYPLPFFQFLAEKFLFEFPGFYDCN